MNYVLYRQDLSPVMPAEPRAIAENLRQAGAMSEYLLYEGREGARIAGDVLARVSVSEDLIHLEIGGKVICTEPVRDPFKQVERLLASLPVSSWTGYGYISFDASKYYHPYSRTMGSPLMQFIIPRFDIRIAQQSLYVHSVDNPEEIARQIGRRRGSTVCSPTPVPAGPSDQEDFCRKVNALVQAIAEGKLQKAILSRCVHVPGTLDLLATYAVASRANNASRSFCFSLGEVGGVGVSPETLLKADADGLVTTNPLAGTRPRRQSPDMDEQLRRQLYSDAKEVKEHALSVLLAQEEMRSVCDPDSVRIYDFMDVKKYRLVQHLSSRVSGRLDRKHTVWDALKALFPGVTVSGITKSQALRWIAELEDEPRGIYGGAVGWIDSSGQADFAIAIRSAFQYGNCIHLNAGAGIVAESVPEREYVETVNKMNTMLSQIVRCASNPSFAESRSCLRSS